MGGHFLKRFSKAVLTVLNHELYDVNKSHIYIYIYNGRFFSWWLVWSIQTISIRISSRQLLFLQNPLWVSLNFCFYSQKSPNFNLLCMTLTNLSVFSGNILIVAAFFFVSFFESSFIVVVHINVCIVGESESQAAVIIPMHSLVLHARIFLIYKIVSSCYFVITEKD